ncbi:unnamed protein product [Cylicostephanus goldi]|uniref:Uncharacterized protein n=1 Tax=Cylicostephanus goldi TaxID=71465 RepID=A0A3P6V0V6_CYLGO|nr:unnamed protein product [Cylicostephanus goldi]
MFGGFGGGPCMAAIPPVPPPVCAGGMGEFHFFLTKSAGKTRQFKPI